MLADQAVESPVDEHAELGFMPPRHSLGAGRSFLGSCEGRCCGCCLLHRDIQGGRVDGRIGRRAGCAEGFHERSPGNRVGPHRFIFLLVARWKLSEYLPDCA